MLRQEKHKVYTTVQRGLKEVELIGNVTKRGVIGKGSYMCNSLISSSWAADLSAQVQ